MKKYQKIIPFLPGYMFNGSILMSTGVALAPTQHIDKKNGDIIYYVRPLFPYGQKIGIFIRHQGLVDWLNSDIND